MTLSYKIQRLLIRVYLRYISAIICMVAGISLLFLKKPGKPEKKLLIIKPDSTGDYILVRNFLRVLRNSDKYRDYHITLCGNQVCRGLAEQFDSDCFDEYIWIKKNRIYLDIFYYVGIARRISGQFQVVIHPVFSREFIFDYFAKISGVKERIGFAGDTVNMNPLYSRMAGKWYTRLIGVDQGIADEIGKNRVFFESILGRQVPVYKPSFESSHVEHVAIPAIPGNYAVIFPGAQLSFRRWPAARFAAVSDLIKRQYGFDVVIAGGPGDAALASEIAGTTALPVTDLTGKTSFPQLIRLISQAGLLVSNDTVAVHIGAALDIPTVVVSQMNHYGRFVPYPVTSTCRMECVIPARYAAMDPAELHDMFIYGSMVDIAGVTEEQVFMAIAKVIEKIDYKSSGE